MAAIDELRLQSATGASLLPFNVKQLVVAEFWKWLRAHWGEEVASINLFIWKKTIKIGDLSVLWVKIFGPEPTA